jgi:tRNA/rRNA methyltransferase
MVVQRGKVRGFYQAGGPPLSAMTPQSSLQRIRVVLSHPSHPGNIGAAARAMKTMGLDRLVLVNPRTFPDPVAFAMSSGAADVLDRAQVCATLAEALAGTVFATAVTARRRELATEPLWAVDAAAELVVHATQGEEVALVFGNETYGLSNEEVALCRRWTTIPANPDYSSLNLAQAVQILCYGLRRHVFDAGAPPPVADAGQPASHEEVERLLASVEAAAVSCGFLDPAQPKRLMLRLRRLFSRAGLEHEEINILRGLLASLLKPRAKSD